MPGRGRPKGQPKTGGRQKGTPNGETKALREMILGALELAGGEQYLLDRARANPTAFLSLIGRTLPTTIQGGENGAPIVVKIMRFGDAAKSDC